MSSLPKGLRQFGVPIVALWLATMFCLIYGPAVGHGFIKDDFRWIRHSQIASLDDVVQIFERSAGGFFRPLVSMSFGANRVMCGLDSRCYGLTNVMFAVACAGGVFVLARRLSLPSWAALVASAVELSLGSANGLYLLAAAMVLMFGSQVWSAWVLIAEVTE